MRRWIAPITPDLKDLLEDLKHENARVVTAYPQFGEDRWIYDFKTFYVERADKLNLLENLGMIQTEINYWILNQARADGLDVTHTGPEQELYTRADKQRILEHEKEHLLETLQDDDVLYYDHPQELGIEYKLLVPHYQ